MSKPEIPLSIVEEEEEPDLGPEEETETVDGGQEEEEESDLIHSDEGDDDNLSRGGAKHRIKFNSQEPDHFEILGEQEDDEMMFGNEEDDDDDDDGPVHFLKEPPQSIYDFLLDDDEIIPEPEILKKISEVDPLTLSPLTLKEAKPIAEYILRILEQDLEAYVQATGVVFPPPLTKQERKKLLLGLTDNDSADSFNSELSEVLPGEPSRIRMFYDKGITVYGDLSLMDLAEDEKVDKDTQVNLHRNKKKPVVRKFSRYTQTLEMTFVNSDTALTIFKQYYPQLDDNFKVKESSRKASEDVAIAKAIEADPNIDSRRKGPQIISLSNKKQLLQPLMEDYFKDEKFWTGSRFIGEYKKRQFYKGEYTHPTGTKIESEFKNGNFHSNKHFGLVKYPRGDTFEGEWENGRYQNGQITFCDGLKFAGNNWKYCEPPDRRFKCERYYGLKPAGLTLFSDQCPAPPVPPGMYDVGEGFYDPRTGDVRGYDGFLLRQAVLSERDWIEKNCRKVNDPADHVAPRFLPERIPGSYAETQQRIPLSKKRYH